MLLSKQIFEFLAYFRELRLMWNHHTPRMTKICYFCWIFDIYDDPGSASGHLKHSNCATVQYKHASDMFRHPECHMGATTGLLIGIIWGTLGF